MSHVDPFDPLLAANRIGKRVQAVANDSVDALDSDRNEGLSELICNCPYGLAP
jgi:hypothetical protein